jgi:ATP-dependent protease ClpP protease subunit
MALYEDTEKAGDFFLLGSIDDLNAGGLAKRMLTLAQEWKRDAKGGTMRLTINSGGGDVDAGLLLGGVIMRIREMGFPVTTRVSGSALSMAFVVAQYGTKREMDATASAHLHTLQVGMPFMSETKIYQDYSIWIQNLKRTLAGLYAARNTAGHNDPEVWLAEYFDGKEHFFTAQQCLDLGMIDEVTAGFSKLQPVSTIIQV